MTFHEELPVVDTVSASGSVSRGVIAAVARISGTAAVPDRHTDDVLAPLYSVIDPEALDSLFDTNRGDPDDCVSFEYEGMTVIADRAGRIRVEPPPAP